MQAQDSEKTLSVDFHGTVSTCTVIPMNRSVAGVLGLFLLLLGGWFALAGQRVTYPPGMLAPAQPTQSMVTPAISFELKKMQVHAVAEFQIQAKVLSRHDYFWDHEARLSPLDLALGWDIMSDQRVVDQIQIHQDGRWYFWSVPQWFVSRSQIELNSANMHLIPANEGIAQELKQVRVGEIVAIGGYLVNVSDGPWRWQSSLTRGDTGKGSCEVVYVQSFQKVSVQ